MGDVTTGANPSNLTAVTPKVVDPGNLTKLLQPANQVELTNNAPIATAATNSTPYGFATADQADDLIATVREIRAGLIALGLFKDTITNSD